MLRIGTFLSELKELTLLQFIKGYPVSLLPICGRIFEQIFYDNMIKFLTENNLISPNQSGFRTSDFCVKQLLSINHEILSAFDIWLEVRGIFLDISKAFDKVWHEGLIFKLHKNVKIFIILDKFLSNQKQIIILKGQFSSWGDICFGVLQSSILWPCLFLIYINDLTAQLKSDCKLFTDDTLLFSVDHTVNISKMIWSMTFNRYMSGHENQIQSWR